MSRTPESILRTAISLSATNLPAHDALDDLLKERGRLLAELEEAQDYAARAAQGAVDRARLPLSSRYWLDAVAERDALQAALHRIAYSRGGRFELVAHLRGIAEAALLADTEEKP